MNLNSNRIRCFLISISILLLLFQTGCWSMDEIEDLSIYVGMGLDVAEETMLEKKLNKLGSDQPVKDLITYTVQIVNKQSEGKEGSSSGGGDPYLNITETGDSLLQMIREFSTRLERPPMGHHLKVIVINEQLAKQQSLNELMDFFMRDNEIRLSSVVLMSSGKARNTLEATGSSVIPSFRLVSMNKNRYRSLQILPPMTFAKLISEMRTKSSYLLQNVVSANGEVKFSGAAVIKGKTQKFRGLLNEEELLGINWLSAGKAGLVKTNDEETKKIVTVDVDNIKRKITSHVNNDKISYEVKIQCDGRIMEDWLTIDKKIDVAFKEKVEQAAEQEVKRVIKIGLAKIQKKYKTDVVGFGGILNIQHPKVWNQVKDDWDNLFSEIPINYSVNINILGYGAKITH